MKDPKDIRKLMLEHDVTAADIGRGLGITRAAVGHVIHGRRATPRIRRAIAEAISMPYTQVWGEEDPEPGAAPGVHKCTAGGERGAA